MGGMEGLFFQKIKGRGRGGMRGGGRKILVLELRSHNSAENIVRCDS